MDLLFPARPPFQGAYLLYGFPSFCQGFLEIILAKLLGVASPVSPPFDTQGLSFSVFTDLLFASEIISFSECPLIIRCSLILSRGICHQFSKLAHLLPPQQGAQ
jgi:hypothetical protein